MANIFLKLLKLHKIYYLSDKVYLVVSLMKVVLVIKKNKNSVLDIN